MRLLLDTHVLLWYIEGNINLNREFVNYIENSENEKYVSKASLWEIAIKTNINKLEISYPLDKIMPKEFQILEIEIPHLLKYQQLPLIHRDPFDRILIAQAQIEDLYILTVDSVFISYGINII